MAIMNNWLLISFLSLLSFGLWGFFTKLTITHVNSQAAIIYQTVGVIIVGLVVLVTAHFKLQLNLDGAMYGVVTGLAYGMGCLLFFLAINRGSIITVVTMTAMYPLVTILLAHFILRDGISIKQMFGIVFAVIAMLMFSI